MKRIVFVLITLFAFTVYGQHDVNVLKEYTSILIFKSEIVNIINGNEIDFLIEKDPNAFSKDKTLTLKVFPESTTQKGTNLIVFTKDGNIYDFNLIFKKPLKLIHHIALNDAHSAIPVNEQIITEQPVEEEYSIKSRKEPKKQINKEISIPTLVEDEMDLVLQNCKKTSNRKKRLFQNLSKSYNVTLSIADMAYSEDKLYMYFDIRNKGGQAYDVAYMRFFLSTNEEDITITTQKDPIDVYYIHNNPIRIEGKSKHKFIAVIDKTSINQNKAITVRIKEKGGERDLNLNIKDQIINNPIRI